MIQYQIMYYYSAEKGLVNENKSSCSGSSGNSMNFSISFLSFTFREKSWLSSYIKENLGNNYMVKYWYNKHKDILIHQKDCIFISPKNHQFQLKVPFVNYNTRCYLFYFPS